MCTNSGLQTTKNQINAFMSGSVHATLNTSCNRYKKYTRLYDVTEPRLSYKHVFSTSCVFVLLQVPVVEAIINKLNSGANTHICPLFRIQSAEPTIQYNACNNSKAPSAFYLCIFNNITFLILFVNNCWKLKRDFLAQ